MQFPKEFFWGAATSSYQIEGWGAESGIGPSIWDDFCAEPGNVFNNETGAVACEHYTRWPEDVVLMKQIGLQAYRFSIAWPRVLPEGTGTVNEKGLAFYDRLVDGLLEAGIEPWATLFHWDYPLALHHRGGWLHPDSPKWFADYTEVLVNRLSDRVKNWMTFNEQQVIIPLGYLQAIKAPGLRVTRRDLVRINHQILLAHGLSVQVIRNASKQPARVGAAPVGITKAPRTESPEDIDAARQAMFAMDLENFWCMTPYTDPMVLGTYPEELHPYLPDGALDDLSTIQQPLDFLGTNIYHADWVESDGAGGWRDVPHPIGNARTSMHWFVVPEALYWGPRFLHERYGLPLVITENGFSNNDWIASDGLVHDPQRIDFTRRYLRQFHRALSEGIPALGYFHWSLLDNFEWELGYSQRFGLIHVDFETQERILKDSAHWYAEVIRSHGGALV